MTRCSLTCCIFLLSLILVGTSVQAEEVVKFGYVDIQKVIFTSETGQKQVQKLKDFQGKRQQRISDLEEQLNQLERELSKQLFTLTEDAKAIKEEDIRTKQLELKRLLEDSEYELSRRKKNLLDILQKEIVLLVQKIGAEENYMLILELTGSNIIFANTANDITARIITEFDKGSK